jgi:hypothetical protein
MKLRHSACFAQKSASSSAASRSLPARIAAA